MPIKIIKLINNPIIAINKRYLNIWLFNFISLDDFTAR